MCGASAGTPGERVEDTYMVRNDVSLTSVTYQDCARLTRGTGLVDESSKDRFPSFNHLTRPWRGGTQLYPVVDEELYCLDKIGRDEDHEGGRDMCTEMFASWYTQKRHDLVSQVHELVVESSQNALNDNFFPSEERKLWHASDLREWKQWSKNSN